MSTEKWVAGATAGWVNAYTAASTFDSIVSGNAILSDLAITNSALDEFADFYISLGSAAFVAPNFVGVYIYPLDADASTYGDGRFGSSAAGPPASDYFAGKITLVAATQAQKGVCRGILLPPGQFKFCLWNQGGVTLAGSGGNTIQYRTYNRAIV